MGQSKNEWRRAREEAEIPAVTRRHIALLREENKALRADLEALKEDLKALRGHLSEHLVETHGEQFRLLI